MKFSFKIRIYLFLIACLLVFGLVSEIRFRFIAGKSADDSFPAFLTQTKVLGRSISSQYHDRMSDARAFSMNPTLLQNDRNRIAQVLDSYTASYSIYDMILVYDLDGNVLGSNHRTTDGKKLNLSGLVFPNFKNKSWFENVLTQDGVVVTEPSNEDWIEKLYGETKATSVFAKLIKDSWGRPYRVIAAFANVKWIEKELLHFNRTFVNQGYGSVKTRLISSEGKTLSSLDGTGEFGSDQEADSFSAPVSKFLNGDTGVMKNDTNIFAFYPVEDENFNSVMGWGIVIQVSNSDLQEGLTGKPSGQTWILIFSIALMIGFGFVFNRKMQKDLEDSLTNMNSALAANRETGKSLKKASKELQDASDKQSLAIQESILALNDLTVMVSQVNEGTMGSRDVSQAIDDRSIGGLKVAERMSNSMDVVHQLEKSMEEISKSIVEISKRSEVFSEIAFKMNLFSFNAAIASEKVGLGHSGFELLSGQARELADYSEKKSKEAEELIRKSIAGVDGNLVRIREVINEVQVTGDKAFHYFGGINSSLQSLHCQIQLVADSCLQQDQNLKKFQSVMDQLNDVVKQSLGAVEVTQTSSKRLFGNLDDLEAAGQQLFRILNGQEFMDSEKKKIHEAVNVSENKDQSFNFDDLKIEKPKLENIDLSKEIVEDDVLNKIA